jgi:GAF domain-containing protein
LIDVDSFSHQRLGRASRGNPINLTIHTKLPHNIRFYAGCPLLDGEGYPLGTLCILDREPRKLRAHEVRAMLELSALASEEIQRRSIR